MNMNVSSYAQKRTPKTERCERQNMYQNRSFDALIWAQVIRTHDSYTLTHSSSSLSERFDGMANTALRVALLGSGSKAVAWDGKGGGVGVAGDGV